MAHMHPREIPATSEVDDSERYVFEILRDGLSDEFWVYHSLPFIEPERAERGEADFIILHRELGLLNLECKAKGVRQQPDGRWVRERWGAEEPTKNPADQAKSRLEGLIERLERPVRQALPDLPPETNFPLPYGWALIFPFTRWDPEKIPPELEPEILLDSDSVDGIEEAVVDAYRFHRRRFDGEPPELSEEDFEKLRHHVFEEGSRQGGGER